MKFYRNFLKKNVDSDKITVHAFYRKCFATILLLIEFSRK